MNGGAGTAKRNPKDIYNYRYLSARYVKKTSLCRDQIEHAILGEEALRLLTEGHERTSASSTGGSAEMFQGLP
jgi:hypothetical protein